MPDPPKPELLHGMMNIEQPEAQSDQDHVNTLMIRQHCLEAIANLMKIQNYFRTQRPTKQRDNAHKAAQNAIDILNEQITALDAIMRQR